MRKLLILMLPILALWGCTDDDKIPADANDNFITELSLTIGDGTTYESVISNDVITMTIPYNVSLDGAIVSVVYTPSATIYPNPQEITNWDEERIFRVVAYNGEERKYTYVVEKSDIIEEGDVQLKTSADIATFAAKGVSVINGNLTIGSNEGEDINSLNGLDNLKEISGTLTILNTFKGEDLTGLDKLESVGSLKIGASESYSTVPLEYVSFNSLKSVDGNFVVYNNNIKYVDFKGIETINGTLEIGSSSLISIQGEKLTNISDDYYVTSENDGNDGGEMKQFTLPLIETIGGKVCVERQANLKEIVFPKLKRVGALIFENIPILLNKISFPDIETINGDCVFTSQSAFQIIGGSHSGNSSLLSFDGFEKLKSINGDLKISFFTATTNIPNITNATVHNVYLEYLTDVQNLNLKNTQFDNTTSKSKVELFRMNPLKIDGSKSMKCVFVLRDMYYAESKGLPVFDGIEDVEGLCISGMQTTTDEYICNLKNINGNFCFDFFSTVFGSKVSFPDLTEIKGYAYFGGMSQFDTFDLYMPNLENVGGQMYVGGLGLNDYDLTSLKSVSVGETTTELGVDDVSDVMFNEFGLGYGLNLHLTTPGKGFLPKLESVGGNGLRLNITDMFIGNPITSINSSLIF